MSASTDAALLACSASVWTGDPMRCRWCDAPLKGRRQRWCKQECADQFGRQHWWTSASRAARQRDVVCVRCGGSGTQVHHKTPLHTLTHTEETMWWRAGDRVRHSDSGCWHHVDGLELLCDQCHHDEHHGTQPEQMQLDAAGGAV